MQTMIRIILALVLLGPAAAFAIPIDGELAFSGNFSVTGGTGLANATGIAFPGNDFDVDGATGAFAAAGIANGDFGAINDFQFSPLSSPVSPLWSIGGFDFTLESVAIDWQSANVLVLSGAGFLAAAGFDNTAAVWNLTANTFGAVFSFSSGTAATSVPEPATLALLSTGLVGFGFARRRRKA